MFYQKYNIQRVYLQQNSRLKTRFQRMQGSYMRYIYLKIISRVSQVENSTGNGVYLPFYCV